ncbi:MAG: hypothetical protein J5I50_03750 [Chitinophagaceae bacterium]|nr:hypothetical protein [Chitinophagaceae bacterium]
MAHKSAPGSEVDIVTKARGFWDKNNKMVTYVGSVVVLLLAGWIVYKEFVQKPKIKKANDLVYIVQKNFNEFANTNDSTKATLAALVLNGDGANAGALKIINNYGGTPAANLCRYYAGASYLSLGQYDKALDQLKHFEANDATQIESRAYGMMGDASAELNKTGDALKYYKKAANVNTKDEYTSSEFLFRAAAYAMSIGDNKESLKLFKELKSQYPGTEKGADADRFLARLGDVSN